MPEAGGNPETAEETDDFFVPEEEPVAEASQDFVQPEQDTEPYVPENAAEQ